MTNTPRSFAATLKAALSDDMDGRAVLDFIMDAARLAAAEPDADRPLWAATFVTTGIDLACDEFGVERTQEWLREMADALPNERPGKGH